jgi:hypothetical protein
MLGGFAAQRDPAQRRLAVDAARHRGSAPSDLIEAVLAKPGVRFVRGEVTAATATRRRLVLKTSGGDFACRRVILATGFSSRRPGGSWLSRMARGLRLPVGPGGYPVIDRWLRWAPGLHVSGPLAELELGPVARNIAGARRAADRLRALVSGAP